MDKTPRLNRLLRRYQRVLQQEESRLRRETSRNLMEWTLRPPTVLQEIGPLLTELRLRATRSQLKLLSRLKAPTRKPKVKARPRRKTR